MQNANMQIITHESNCKGSSTPAVYDKEYIFYPGKNRFIRFMDNTFKIN